MNALNTIALVKSVTEKEEKAARPELKAGRHLVNFTVRVQGALSVSEDTQASPTASAMSLEGVATVLYHTGATRKAAIEALARVALKADSEADEKRQAFVNAIVGDLRAMFAALPKVPKKGQVRAALVVTELDPKVPVVTEEMPDGALVQ